NNTPVHQGDTIAASGGAVGQPGSGSSKGPHVHFEYAPRGSILTKGNRIDPVPCMGQGSLTIGPTSPEEGGAVGGGTANQASATILYTGPAGSEPAGSELEFVVDGVSLGSSSVVFPPSSTRAFVYSPGRFTPLNVFGHPVSARFVLRDTQSGSVIDEKNVTAHTTFNPY